MPIYQTSNEMYPEYSNIDLREELSAVLRGRIGLIPQGRSMILRRLTDTPCTSCFNQLTGSPTEGCTYCQGEGFPFYESTELMYIARGAAPVYKPGFLGTGQYPQTSYGYTDPNRGTGYCEYTVFPDYDKYINGTKKNIDKIYELKAGDQGGLAYPIVRTTKWKILTLTPLMGDFGRVEFFELSLEIEDF